VGAVLDPDLWEDSLTGSNFMYLLCSFGPADRTLFPMAATTTPLLLLLWALALAEPLVEIVGGELEAVFFKLLLDFLLLHTLSIHEGF